MFAFCSLFQAEISKGDCIKSYMPTQKVATAVQMFTYPRGSALGQVLIKLTVLSSTCTKVLYQDSSIVLLPFYVLFSLSLSQISGCD